MTARTTLAKGIEGRHVLWGLCGFFGVIFAVNAIFVYAAEKTFSGGDTSDPYRKGLNYNATLRASERQAERGWQTDIAYDAKTGRLALNFVDKSALPITGLGVNATLSRAATDQEDRRVVMVETSPGVYAATVNLAPGLWVLSAASHEAGAGHGTAYRLKRRLFVAETP
jgi:nitrogen fixation protein FixH